MGLETLSATSAAAMNRLQSNVVKAFTGYYRLKDFIHALRACKTLSAERALIAQESFAIRTAFKEDISADHRYNSIAKLLYIYLLGYPAHFGQIECLKLAASHRLTDKRLGYLGVVLLLDEQQQTLTLVTNSLKIDLNSSNPTIVALALSTMAAISSAEIAYELADEVERLLSSTNPYLRKKAAFCACKLMEKVPELGEDFEKKVSSLIGDRNHSVALGGISLAHELLHLNPTAMLPLLRRSLVPQLVRLLQTLITSGFSMDYDVGGINDPFLQVKILHLLRVLGEGDSQASDLMVDVLTHLATSIDGNRNVSQAVLYEAILTILRIKADDSLRTMAINILARLLSSNSENNLRYVGLALLNRIVEGVGGDTVQRHRSTVLDCLSDPDASIRKRAVEVGLALINRETIRAIASHLMNTILDPARSYSNDDKSSELTALTITKLSILAAQYAPSSKWYADTLVYLLSCLHHKLRIPEKEEIVSLFLRIINNTDEIHRYATEILWKKISSFDLVQEKPTEALMQASAWCLGEFGDLLVETKIASSFTVMIDALYAWSKLDLSSSCLCYIISALGKLSHKNEASLETIKGYVESISKANYRLIEVYQKGIETLAFMQNSVLRSMLFTRIPADKKYSIGAVPSTCIPPSMSGMSGEIVGSRSESPAPALDVFAELALLSLDGLNSPNKGTTQGSSNLPSPLSFKASSAESAEWGALIQDVNGLCIYLKLAECKGNGQDVLIIGYNRLSGPLSNVQIQCAVPKSLRIILEPPSGTTIFPNGNVTQLLHITYASDEPTVVDLPKIEPSRVKLRIKASFTPPLSTQPITEIIAFNGF